MKFYRILLFAGAMFTCSNNAFSEPHSKTLMNPSELFGSVEVSVGGAQAYDGGISGGGGDAITCYNSKGVLSSAHLLDTYEGRSIFGDATGVQPGDMKSRIESALKRLNLTGYRALILNVKNLNEAVDVVLENQHFIPQVDRLKNIEDSYEGFLPANCHLEQAAVFIDSSHIVFDERIWNALSEEDRAGLILHEAIYWFERKNNGEYDSRRTRRAVSLSLAETWEFEDTISGLPTSYILCNSMDLYHGIRRSPTIFAVHEKDGKQILQFFSIDGNFVLSKTTATLPFKFPFLSGSTDRRISSHRFQLQSKHEGGDFLTLDRGLKTGAGGHEFVEITLSGVKESYPAKVIGKTQISCMARF